MKKFIAVFMFMFLGYVSVFAEKWLVIIRRGGETHMLILNYKPFPGEGITIWGPFPDRVGPPETINDIDVDTQLMDGEAVPQPSGTISSPATADAYFAYRKGNNLNVVQMDEKTDWKAIQAYMEENGGCTNSKFAIFFMPKGNGKTLKINSKEIPIIKGTFSVSYGDIIMGGKPVGFE